MSPARRRMTTALLAFFAVWDAILAVLTIAFPERWFRTFHGSRHVDPQGLLARTGAIWASFSLFHLIALLRWRARPLWLVIVGGMRLGEIFADWTYMYRAKRLTPTGRASLFLAAPSNILFALFFIRGYLRASGSERSRPERPRPEPSRPERSRTEPSRPEPSRTEPSRTDP